MVGFSVEVGAGITAGVGEAISLGVGPIVACGCAVKTAAGWGSAASPAVASGCVPSPAAAAPRRSSSLSNDSHAVPMSPRAMASCAWSDSCVNSTGRGDLKVEAMARACSTFSVASANVSHPPSMLTGPARAGWGDSEVMAGRVGSTPKSDALWGTATSSGGNGGAGSSSGGPTTNMTIAAAAASPTTTTKATRIDRRFRPLGSTGSSRIWRNSMGPVLSIVNCSTPGRPLNPRAGR